MGQQQVIADAIALQAADEVVADRVEAWLTTGQLPPELITGHKLIDFEHRFLLSTIAQLRKVCVDLEGHATCHGCGEERRVSCENNLISLLGDLFAFILEHFKSEEDIMRESLLLMIDREVCAAHMDDHAEISGMVQQLVASLDQRLTVQRIRELDRVLVRWLTSHIELHDMLLVGWLGREDSMVKGL